MATGKHVYVRDDLKVRWDPTVCEHSGICVRGMVEVFNPRRRPWIILENGDPDAIREQVRKCPSGAISLVDDPAEPEA